MQCALEGAAVRVAPSMNAQDVANTVWVLATLGWQADVETAAMFQQRIEALVCSFGLLESSSSIVVLSQLLQAHLASQFLGLGLITLPASVLQVAVQASRDEARKVTVSNGQREVGESLHRLGIPHELEHVTADGLFSIDCDCRPANCTRVRRPVALYQKNTGAARPHPPARFAVGDGVARCINSLLRVG
jgi:hypothetical protein